MKKVLLAYNPISGSRIVPKKLDYIVGRFLECGMIAVPYRLDGECGNRLGQLLAEDEYCCVVVSGGDGTINTVAGTILAAGLDMPMGIIPAGTCNDFARSLGIPTDLKKSIDVILGGKTALVDAGLINDEKYCLNTCAGGKFVDVSYNTSNEFKKNFGPFAYYLTALGEITAFKTISLKLTTDDETVEGDFLLFLILNGKHAAGLTNLIGAADYSDGYMDIILLKNCLHIELAALLFKVLNNEFINDRNVRWLRTRNCRIEGDGGFHLSVDGERWKTLPISVSFIRQVLKVFVK